MRVCRDPRVNHDHPCRPLKGRSAWEHDKSRRDRETRRSAAQDLIELRTRGFPVSRVNRTCFQSLASGVTRVRPRILGYVGCISTRLRNAIAGARSHDGLWRPTRDRPMDSGSNYDAVRRRTTEALGLRDQSRSVPLSKRGPCLAAALPLHSHLISDRYWA